MNGGRFGGNGGVLCPPFEVEHPQMLEVEYTLSRVFVEMPVEPRVFEEMLVEHSGNGAV